MGISNINGSRPLDAGGTSAPSLNPRTGNDADAKKISHADLNSRGTTPGASALRVATKTLATLLRGPGGMARIELAPQADSRFGDCKAELPDRSEVQSMRQSAEWSRANSYAHMPGANPLPKASLPDQHSLRAMRGVVDAILAGVQGFTRGMPLL